MAKANVTVEGVTTDQVVKLCQSQGWTAKPARAFWQELLSEPLFIITALAFGTLLVLFGAYVVASMFTNVNEALGVTIAGAVASITGVVGKFKGDRDTNMTFAQTGYQPAPKQTFITGPEPRMPNVP